MWARFGNLVLGIWLMAAPGIIAYSGSAGMNHLIVGPIIASFAVIGMWEVARGVRWINLVLGIWLAVSPLLLSDGEVRGTVNSIITGFLVTGLSFIKGRIRNRFNGGWAAVFKRTP